MNLQTLIDGMSAQWQRERSQTQMTLGKLIDQLEKMSPETQVANLRNPDSYRGYYCDLYFEIGEGTRPAIELLADCKSAMVQVFTGYKGGDYVMCALTPLWIANYGCLGKKLMAIHIGGKIETAEDSF